MFLTLLYFWVFSECDVLYSDMFHILLTRMCGIYPSPFCVCFIFL